MRSLESVESQVHFKTNMTDGGLDTPDHNRDGHEAVTSLRRYASPNAIRLRTNQ
jgi:hypothetical protein